MEKLTRRRLLGAFTGALLFPIHKLLGSTAPPPAAPAPSIPPLPLPQLDWNEPAQAALALKRRARELYAGLANHWQLPVHCLQPGLNLSARFDHSGPFKYTQVCTPRYIRDVSMVRAWQLDLCADTVPDLLGHLLADYRLRWKIHPDKPLVIVSELPKLYLTREAFQLEYFFWLDYAIVEEPLEVMVYSPTGLVRDHMQPLEALPAGQRWYTAPPLLPEDKKLGYPVFSTFREGLAFQPLRVR